MLFLIEKFGEILHPTAALDSNFERYFKRRVIIGNPLGLQRVDLELALALFPDAARFDLGIPAAEHPLVKKGTKVASCRLFDGDDKIFCLDALIGMLLEIMAHDLPPSVVAE